MKNRSISFSTSQWMREKENKKPKLLNTPEITYTNKHAEDDFFGKCKEKTNIMRNRIKGIQPKIHLQLI